MGSAGSVAAIKGTVLRVTLLDVCGNPVTGASARIITTNMFTQVQMSPQYETGTDFFERTADGGIGVNQIDPPILKRMQIQTDLISVDPDLMPVVLSARELVTSAPVSGYGFAMSEGASSAHFSLEVWQRVAGAGACSPGGLAQYIYNAWPHCYNAILGAAYTISNARSTVSFQSDTAAASPTWLHGPGTISYLPATGTVSALATEHWLWNITTNIPPLPSVGYSLVAP